MTDNELKKLSRSDLLELLIAQSKENEQLRSELEQAQAQLADRQIALDKAGSIAEASLQLSGIFQAAQDAASQYLENVQRLSGYQEEICARMERESRRTADLLLAETQTKCQTMEAETQTKCQTMEAETQAKCQELLASAQREAQSYWDEAECRLEKFCAAHEELHEFLASHAGKDAQT